MKKVVIYSRVSSQQQNNESQIDVLLSYAKANNFIVDKIFSEKVSAYIKSNKKKNKERTEYDNMKEYVLDNGIKTILMLEISRFQRNTLKSLQEIKFFSEKDINLFFLKDNINTLDLSSKLILTVLSSVAEIERDTIVSRTSRGKQYSAEKGKRTGLMTLPYGYKAVDSYLVIDEEESKIIKMIFDLAEKGIAQRSIAKHLNSLKIPTRWTKMGRINRNDLGEVIPIEWKPNAIGVILRNTLYKGIRKYKDLIFEAPIIISPEQWDIVQTKTIQKVGYKVKGTKYEYLLKGKIQCGKCGRHYGVRTETRYAKESSFYACNGAKDLVLRCRNGQYSSKVFDKGVFEMMLRHQDLWIKMREETLNNFNIEEKTTQVKYYQEELDKLDKKQKRTIELYKDGHIAKDDLEKDIKSIKLKQNEANYNIGRLKDEISNYDKMKSDINMKDIIEPLFGEDGFNKKMAFMNKYLDKIVFTKVDRSDKIGSLSQWVSILDKEPLVKRDNIAYLEIYAFGSTKPLKCFLTNWSRKIISIPDDLNIGRNSIVPFSDI